MVNEWHGIPFIRRWRRQEMGKVGIVLPRYELHLTFKWWRTARVFLQRWVKSLSVLQSPLKPLFWFFRASVAWLDAPTHFSVICCFQFAISLLSGNTTLKKRKQCPITTGFLHEKLTKPLLDRRALCPLQTCKYKSIWYNFKSIALHLLIIMALYVLYVCTGAQTKSRAVMVKRSLSRDS